MATIGLFSTRTGNFDGVRPGEYKSVNQQSKLKIVTTARKNNKMFKVINIIKQKSVVVLLCKNGTTPILTTKSSERNMLK